MLTFLDSYDQGHFKIVLTFHVQKIYVTKIAKSVP